MFNKLIYNNVIFCWVVQFIFISPLNPLSASQVELNYYSVRTLDTVGPEGIYYQVILSLDAPREVIKNIRYVTYQLEEPFYRKSIVVRSRANNFQFLVNTLSNFDIKTQIHFNDGKNQTLSQYVILGIQRSPLTPTYQLSLSHEVLQVSAESKQDERYVVSLYLEGSPEDLAQVDKVEYFFPKSFSRAPITIRGPSVNYQLQLEISQQSSIQAYVYFKDGTVSELVRFIYFKYY